MIPSRILWLLTYFWVKAQDKRVRVPRGPKRIVGCAGCAEGHDHPDRIEEKDVEARCPKCDFCYGWNGRTCSHCGYGR